MKNWFGTIVTLSIALPVGAISSFGEAKKFLPDIHQQLTPQTLYCGCSYQGKQIDLSSCGYKVYKNQKRAMKLEWEHVVPAHAFGHAFIEWREGDPKCEKKGKKYKGRDCARKNPLFARMESDLYNLYPEIGELNGLRSNFSMTDFGENEPLTGAKTFGDCKAIIKDRKFEPMDRAKGIVARIYMYMDMTYPGRGIISNKNRKLFEAWNKMFPVTEGECLRAKKIDSIQGGINQILKDACEKNKGPEI